MAVVVQKPVEFTPPMVGPSRAGLGRARKIGFLGSHSATLEWAPWDDPTWELWGHASARGWYKRPADRYFDLHRRECWTRSNNKGAKYPKWLAQNTVAIYMQDRYPEVPASVRYPLERVLAEFRPYFTNHVAYMIALALMEGVTHLGFFGVNYGVDSEYGTQRGSCEYWMGQAEARGVHLVLPKFCTLLQEPNRLYGYDSHDEHGQLVPEYRKRVWTPGGKPRPDVELGPTGLAVPPAEIRDLIAQEQQDAPRPAGVLRMEDFHAPLAHVG